jgi:hypothetical protein
MASMAMSAPGTDHVQGGLASGAIKRSAQHLAVDGYHVLQLLGKLRHKRLRAIAKLIWIEIAKQWLRLS